MGRRNGRAWERSLLCVVKALQGLLVLVELQNDACIRGLLEDCDDAMNDQTMLQNNHFQPCPAPDVSGVTMKDATIEDVEGNERNLRLIFIRGSNIRFVHIPDSINVSDAVEEMRLMQDKAAFSYMSAKGGPSRKSGDSSTTKDSAQA